MNFRTILHDYHYTDTWIKSFIAKRSFIYLISFLGIFIDKVIFLEVSLIGIYTLIMLMFGIIYKSPLLLFLQSCSLVIVELYPFENIQFQSVLLLLATFFLVGFSISSLIETSVKQRRSLIELTTALAKSIDSRDPYTATHSENVARYSQLIAKNLNLSKKICKNIHLGGLIHDVGKIGIPEHILNKPSKLTKDEYQQIKQHPVIGYEMIKHINSFKEAGILDMVLYHHERYDGEGYPEGLKANEIPLVARIMAVADSFDAMTSKRIYKDKKDLDHVIKDLENNKGLQFDPHIADVFLKILKSSGTALFKSD